MGGRSTSLFTGFPRLLHSAHSSHSQDIHAAAHPPALPPAPAPCCPSQTMSGSPWSAYVNVPLEMEFPQVPPLQAACLGSHLAQTKGPWPS